MLHGERELRRPPEGRATAENDEDDERTERAFVGREEEARGDPKKWR